MMTEYKDASSKNANPNRKHVKIFNSQTKEWEYKTLVKRVDRISGNRLVGTWKVEGTLEGYSPEELNSKYKNQTLFILDSSEVRDLGKRSSLNKARIYTRRQKHVYDDSDLNDLRRERNEASGENARIRAELRGMNDYQIFFEDSTKIELHKQKIIFFRGTRAFQGALPFYSEGVQIANRKAFEICKLLGFSDVRGTAGNPNNEKHKKAFLGSISCRCQNMFEANDLGEKIAEIVGYTGQIGVHHLGNSAKREIELYISVRDTKRRVELEAA